MKRSGFFFLLFMYFGFGAFAQGIPYPFVDRPPIDNVRDTLPPQTYYLPRKDYSPLGEIRLGQGKVYPIWNASYNMYIPANRITWAMAMAHAYQLFRTMSGQRSTSINAYFSTPMQETNCGCDPAMVNVPGGNFAYQADTEEFGCYQIEGPTTSAFAELMLHYKNRYKDPSYHKRFIADANFETAALGKAYYDIMSTKFFDIPKKYRFFDFMDQAQDPLAGSKVTFLAYNRGINEWPIQEMFTGKRTTSLSAPVLEETFGYNSTEWGYLYIKQNIHIVHVLSDEVNKIDPAYQSQNQFFNYYDEPVKRTDVIEYLNKMFPFYPEADQVKVMKWVLDEFDCINDGNPISYRYDYGKIVDVIMMVFPVDDPTHGLVWTYGIGGDYPQAIWPPIDPDLSIDAPQEPQLCDYTFKIDAVPPVKVIYQPGDAASYTLTDESNCKSTITWTISNGTIAAISPDDLTVDVIWTTPTEGCLTANATSAGCVKTDQICVDIGGNPPVDLGPDTTFCVGNSLQLDAGAPPAQSYLWNTGSTDRYLQVNSTGSYYVDVRFDDGGTGSDTVQVNVEPLPVVNLGADRIYAGTPLVLDAGIPGASYLWSTTESTQQISVNSPGIYSVRVETGNGCSGTDEVEIYPDNKPNLGPDQTLCAGEEVELDAGPGLSYQWNTGSTDRKIMVSTPGTYHVNVSYASGPDAEDELKIQYVDQPIVNLGVNRTIWPPHVITLDAGNPGANYLWSTGANTRTISVNAAGIYSVQVSTGVAGCEASDEVEIIQGIPGVVDLGPDQVLCEGTPLTLDAGPLPTGGNYLWSDGSANRYLTVNSSGSYSITVQHNDGSPDAMDEVLISFIPKPMVNLGPDRQVGEGESMVLDAENPGANYLWSTGATTQSISVSAPGTYRVKVSASIPLCEGEDEIIVIQKDKWEVDLGPDRTICTGNAIELDAGNPGASFLWNTGATTQTIVVNSAGTYEVSVSKDGFTQTDRVVLKEDGLIKPNVQPEELLCKNGNLKLDAGVLAPYYRWNTGETSRSISISQPGIYTVSTGNNCLEFMDAQIAVVPDECEEIAFPNVFTPNNDGRNDVFKPIAFVNARNYVLTIVNRWGGHTFKSTDMEQGWNGNVGQNGGPATKGVYYWMVEYVDPAGKRVLKSGYVKLLR